MKESIRYVKSNASIGHVFEQSYHKTSGAYFSLTTAFLQKLLKADSMFAYFDAQGKVCHLGCQEELSVYLGDIIERH